MDTATGTVNLTLASSVTPDTAQDAGLTSSTVHYPWSLLLDRGLLLNVYSDVPLILITSVMYDMFYFGDSVLSE